MARAFLIVLDSFGIGGAPDSAHFGDEGANTAGHIAEYAATGRADGAGRSGPLNIPNLISLGLAETVIGASGERLAVASSPLRSDAAFGHAAETSRGKDTPSGHWELAGVPVTFDWTYFPNQVPTFPKSFTDVLLAEAKLPGFLGDCHASGTEIIARLGEEHCRAGHPIIYTSADSVVQIAAHEESFGLERLLELCQQARHILPDTVGRVIARPFLGDRHDNFERTGNRRDFAVSPPSPTLLEIAGQSGCKVLSIGKIADIFAHQGTGEVVKASGHDQLFGALMQAVKSAPTNSLTVMNFVNFDTLFGHRRDVAGYAGALEAFDRLLPHFLDALQEQDLAVFTADHGCDPSWPGSDHTREQVPALFTGPQVSGRNLGQLGFSDVGATLASHLGLPKLSTGTAAF